MNRSLGKIVLIFLFLQLSLFANVRLDAPANFIKGDAVVFKITASGSNVDMPDITKIGKFPVQSVGKSMQTQIINGDRSQQLIQSFAFYPDRNITIPSFEVKVDGKVEKTMPKHLTMAKMVKTVSNLYDLNIKVDKKNPYVGEGVVLDVVFRYRKDLNIMNLEFEKPDFEGFWVKQIKDPKIHIQEDPRYSYQTLQFLIFPQKAGKMELGPFKIGVVSLNTNMANSFFLNGATQKKLVYSNTVDLDVKGLPANVRLIGDFKLSTTVDKLKVKQGEAISYKVKIVGDGNVDDIPEMKLNIPSATVYENPAKKQFHFENGKYGGVYTKVFSIVPSQSFILPGVSLKYFDKNTQTVKTLQSKEYHIEVEGVQKKEVKLETANKEDTTKKDNVASTHHIDTGASKQQMQVPLSNYEKITYFLLGVGSIVGILLLLKIVQNLKRDKQTKHHIPLHNKINKTKSKKELLQILAIYINIDKDLDKIIYQIEQTDDPKTLQTLKKEIIKMMKAKDIK